MTAIKSANRTGYGMLETKEAHLFSDGTVNDLKMRKYLGSLNKCPKCEHTGEFGSILTQMELDGRWFLCCGWCGTITFIPDEEMRKRKYD